MNESKVVKNTVNSILVKRMISDKGWTKQQAANHVMSFLTSGTDKSFYQFMVEAK
jgi:hypothetical protein